MASGGSVVAGVMGIDHVAVWASDVVASRHFYDVVLAPLRPAVGSWRDFRLAQAGASAPATRGLHVAFVARSRGEVDAFWRSGLDAGYESDGAPGERPVYAAGYYGGFLLDPDGNSLEAVNLWRPRELGSLIDHLWIRVSELAATRCFWDAVAPALGLTLYGERQERFHVAAGQRSFALVQDSRPLTKHVKLAFSVSDDAAVDGFVDVAAGMGFARCGEGCVLDPDGNQIVAVSEARATSLWCRPRRGEWEAFVPPLRPRTPPTAEQIAADIARRRAEEGLPADRDTVRSAIENSERPEFPWPGLYYTPEEERDIASIDDDLYDRAEAVFANAPEDLVEIRWCWHEGRRAIQVTVTRDPERYDRELGELLGRERLVIATAWYSERELRALQEQVEGDFDVLRELGIEPSSLGIGDPFRVEFEYFSRYHQPSRELLSERYGPALDPVWRGPSMLAEEPQAFGSWITDGERLTVFYFLDTNGHHPGSCTVEEQADRLIVALTVLKPQGVHTLAAGGFTAEATVPLRRPVGSRTVIDAATGEPRQPWAGANNAPAAADWHHLTGDGSL